jgi:nucleoside-diphosphate kinase
MTDERTLAIIKPNITKKNLIGEIISVWEKKGLRIIGIKMVKLTNHQAADFYTEHREKPFFVEMVKFMCSTPVVVICLEGKNAVKINREIMGATNPAEAREGTIRKNFGENIQSNAVHGSDSLQAAHREINYFFSSLEIFAN